MKLRPAQERILAYQSGRMAVSAVPGSGKTFILTRLVAQLLADGRLDIDLGQQVLVVTYLNSSVDTFKARVSKWLHELNLPPTGYDVRTLHSLAREILLFDPAAAGIVGEFPILDEGQSSLYLARAVNGWIKEHPAAWHAFLPEEAASSPRLRARWRRITERAARDLIRLAKNGRYTPAAIWEQMELAFDRWTNELGAPKRDDESNPELSKPPVSLSLIQMLTGIYSRYQAAVETQGALDFDDLVWQATDLLLRNSDIVEQLRHRWPYVLEDEAQDSVPLQETLLETLTGPAGNWVRVGDPNQAITSSFTSAHPRHFRAFLARPEVIERPLPDSGRSSRKIIELANHLVEWACTKAQVPEVRDLAFRMQTILPTQPGDAQPNPPDAQSVIRIRVYQHREREELPTVARAAWEQVQADPEATVAILVPTNESGYAVGEALDALNADYDELLRGGGRILEIAAALHAVLDLLAHPLSAKRLEAGYSALLGMEALPTNAPLPSECERILTLLRSVRWTEALLYPPAGADFSAALPQNVATPAEQEAIAIYVAKMRDYFAALTLPPDALVLTLADDLFRNDADLSIAYQISGYFRSVMDSNPSWRLPELVAQLEGVVAGRISLTGMAPRDTGYEPQPGRITLTTQHRAKGLEWDTVFLVGIDSFWIPSHLDARFLGVHDFLGGDPSAEAAAQLRLLMQENAGLLPGRDATETAHIEVIAERLRLLYVGITRARRKLFISRSKTVTVYQKERDSEASTALGVLYQHLQGPKSESRS